MYKAKGIFICRHPVHKQFDFTVSPYHILKQKKCYKKGCVEFLWRCNVAIKGKKCPRDYKHVGRNCFSCKYYYDEKICRIPEALIDDAALKQFFYDLDEYEFWLTAVLGRRVDFSGKIASVFPSLKKIIDDGKSSMRMNGFLIKFASGHIGEDFFDDTIYLKIGAGFLSRWEPAPDDEIECTAILNNDRGRVVLAQPRRIEINRGGGSPIIDYSKALVGKTTGAIVKDNIIHCHNCPYGAILDIEEISPKQNSYRRFYCLRGIEYSKDCLVRLDRILQDYKNVQQTAG